MPSSITVANGALVSRVQASAALTWAAVSTVGTATSMFSAKPTLMSLAPRPRIAWTARPCASTAWCRTWFSSPSESWSAGARSTRWVLPPPMSASMPWCP